jgi:hypothetical protein
MRREDEESITDVQGDIHEVAAAEAIVGTTGRFIRRQVWGAVTVVSRHLRHPAALHGLNSSARQPSRSQ